jgi:hypothetical protein
VNVTSTLVIGGVTAGQRCGPEAQKRPTYVAKETYICCKRDLHIMQKRPTYVAKETYYSAKETWKRERYR